MTPSVERVRGQAGVLFSSIVGLALSVPCVFIATLPVFMLSMSEEFGWSRTRITAGSSIALFTVVAAPYLGSIVDRIGPRRVVLIATPITGLALASLYLLPPIFPLYLLICFVLGLVGLGSGSVTYLCVLPRWFDRRLGLSLGVAMMGIGIGFTLMPFLAQWLLEAIGWRAAYVALGLLLLCIAFPLAALFLDDGTVAPSPTGASRAIGAEPYGSDLSYAETLKTPLFWIVIASAFASMVAVTACSVHLVPMLLDRGFTGPAAVRTASFLGLSVLGSRLLSGILLDLVPAWIIGAVVYALAAVGAILMTFEPSGPALAFTVICIGVGQGVEGDLLPYMMRRYFGVSAFGRVFGTAIVAYGLGATVGPLLAAQAFDRFGGYTAVLYGAGALAAGAAALMIFVVRPLANLRALAGQ